MASGRDGAGLGRPQNVHDALRFAGHTRLGDNPAYNKYMSHAIASDNYDVVVTLLRLGGELAGIGHKGKSGWDLAQCLPEASRVRQYIASMVSDDGTMYYSITDSLNLGDPNSMAFSGHTQFAVTARWLNKAEKKERKFPPTLTSTLVSASIIPCESGAPSSSSSEFTPPTATQRLSSSSFSSSSLSPPPPTSSCSSSSCTTGSPSSSSSSSSLRPSVVPESSSTREESLEYTCPVCWKAGSMATLNSHLDNGCPPDTEGDPESDTDTLTCPKCSNPVSVAHFALHEESSCLLFSLAPDEKLGKKLDRIISNSALKGDARPAIPYLRPSESPPLSPCVSVRPSLDVNSTVLVLIQIQKEGTYTLIIRVANAQVACLTLNCMRPGTLMASMQSYVSGLLPKTPSRGECMIVFRDELVTFRVRAVHQSGVFIPNGGSKIYVQLATYDQYHEGWPNTEDIICGVDEDNGSYLFTLQAPSVVGTYYVRAFIYGYTGSMVFMTTIKDSPFLFIVESGEPCARTSKMYSGIFDPVVGENLRVVVQTKTASGRSLTRGGQQVTTSLRQVLPAPGEVFLEPLEYPGTVVDLNDGQYNVSLCALKSGSYVVDSFLNGRIVGGPHQPFVIAPCELEPEMSTIKVMTSVVRQGVFWFDICCRDKYGNPTEKGLNSLEVPVVRVSPGQCRYVLPASKGFFRCSVYASEVGPLTIDVSVGGVAHIAGCPLVVEVLPLDYKFYEDDSCESDLLNLPDELLLLILQFCTATSVNRLGMTCRRLLGLSDDASIWRLKCQTEYPVTMSQVTLDQVLSVTSSQIGSGSTFWRQFFGVLVLSWSFISSPKYSAFLREAGFSETRDVKVIKLRLGLARFVKKLRKVLPIPSWSFAEIPRMLAVAEEAAREASEDDFWRVLWAGLVPSLK